MKKQFIILITIVALSAAGGAYYYFSRPVVQQFAFETVLPSDTVGLIKVCELTRQIEQFENEPLGQSLAKMDIPAIMDLLKISSEDQKELLRIKEKIRTTISSTWFDVLFGQEIGLALFPLPPDFEKVENFDEKQFLDALVTIGRPKHPAKVLESLNSMFAQQLEIQTQEYKQWEINQFSLQNGCPVYYALANGLVIAAMTPDLVKRCLGQSLDSTSSLLQAKNYQTYCGDLFKPGQTDMLLFGDSEYFLSTIRNGLASQAEKDPERALLEKQLAEMQGLTTFAMASYDDGGPLLHNRLLFGIDRAGLSATLQQAFGKKPSKNPTLEHTPAQALIYSWQNNFDLNFYWQEFQKSPELTAENIRQIKQDFSRMTGVELESFLAAFGSQLAFLIDDVNTNGMFPIPEMALLFDMEQPEMFEQVVQKFVGQFGLPMEQETYKGAEIFSVSLPLGADLSPAYVCDNSFCTIAVNKRLLKSTIDAPENDSLGDQPNFKAIDKGLSGENNQISFINMTEMIVKSREVASWSLAWMAATQPDHGDKAKKFVALVLNPLLDGLSMFNSIGSRVVIEDGRMINDVYTSVNRP